MSKAAVLNKIGIKPEDGATATVNKTEAYIASSADKLATANSVIEALGGKPESDSDVARVVAESMVLDVKGKKAPDQAKAQAKAKELFEKEPYFKRDAIANAKPAVVGAPKPTKTGRKKGAGNDKHSRADAFVGANKDKFVDRGEFVRALAKHLGTNYAGAYFYMRNAEKKLGLKLTSRKGRRPKAK